MPFRRLDNTNINSNNSNSKYHRPLPAAPAKWLQTEWLIRQFRLKWQRCVPKIPGIEKTPRPRIIGCKWRWIALRCWMKKRRPCSNALQLWNRRTKDKQCGMPSERNCIRNTTPNCIRCNKNTMLHCRCYNKKTQQQCSRCNKRTQTPFNPFRTSWKNKPMNTKLRWKLCVMNWKLLWRRKKICARITSFRYGSYTKRRKQHKRQNWLRSHPDRKRTKSTSSRKS
mmetsp:Transcript_8286/g.22997  ORF Transcript_8286/g.22997 Transcript_8286/m.22997 type:complete len:225 (+) Transcript_8286:360-1034(+)